MRAMPRATRALVLVAGAVALASLWAKPAAAHVTISEGEQAPGAHTVLTVSVPHGCDGSPTTQVKIGIPESVPQVTPTVHPSWDVATSMAPLAEPVADGHGAQLAERVSEVIYTARVPLPHDLRDSFELSLRTPDDPGATLYFPTVQICEEGETAWVQTPPAGDPDAELDEPAPKVTLLAGPDGGSTAEAVAAPDAPATSEGSSDALAVAALAVGAVGVLLGGGALATRRRRG